jgi:GrpB-like predicted nucleotidyltransferase (UPF0157 family)
MTLTLKALTHLLTLMICVSAYGQQTAIKVSTPEETKVDLRSVPCKDNERLAAVKAMFERAGALASNVSAEKYENVENLVIRKQGDPSDSIVIGAHYDVEHVGSTAISGMPAKPIIDLVVVVGSLNEAEVWIPKLESLGYEQRANDDVPDRIFFAKGPRIRRTHHLSLTEARSQFYTEKVLFRDYLCAHREAFDEYAELKTRLAQQYPTDRDFYTKGKQDFVEGIIRLAIETSL